MKILKRPGVGIEGPDKGRYRLYEEEEYRVVHGEPESWGSHRCRGRVGVTEREQPASEAVRRREKVKGGGENGWVVCRWLCGA